MPVESGVGVDGAVTPALLRSAVDAAGDGLAYYGLKIGIRPRDADYERRLAIIRNMLAELNRTSN